MSLLPPAKISWADEEVDVEPPTPAEAKEDPYTPVVARKGLRLGPRQPDSILVFQEAFTNATYVYTKQVLTGVRDLERLFSAHESRRCAQKGIAYKYEYYHGFSLDTRTVHSFHHGRLRDHVKLTGAALAAYMAKIRPCMEAYKRPCHACQGERVSLGDGMALCFACNQISKKKH